MFWRIQVYQFECDDCFIKERYRNVLNARYDGWAVSKDYKKCYCPKCALIHRNVGRNGVKKKLPLKEK